MLILQYIAATFMKSVLFLCRPVPWPFRVGLAIQAFFVFFISFEYFRKTCYCCDRSSRENISSSSTSSDSESESGSDDEYGN